MKPSAPYGEVTPTQVLQKITRGENCVLVDVRTPPEYARRSITDAILMPLDALAARVGDLDRDAEIICLCEHGIRSEMAAQYLAAVGFPRVATMTGGMAAYEGPVKQSTKQKA